ncbi:MAG: hypothetical protein R3C49_01175 [Planctomycetaceae bacterium]
MKMNLSDYSVNDDHLNSMDALFAADSAASIIFLGYAAKPAVRREG